MVNCAINHAISKWDQKVFTALKVNVKTTAKVESYRENVSDTVLYNQYVQQYAFY